MYPSTSNVGVRCFPSLKLMTNARASGLSSTFTSSKCTPCSRRKCLAALESSQFTLVYIRICFGFKDPPLSALVQCSNCFSANEHHFLCGGSRRSIFRVSTLGVAARSRELDRDWRNPYHGFSVPFVQETVSRNALSCKASTPCRMPQSNASNCSAESSTGASPGKWRRILPTRT